MFAGLDFAGKELMNSVLEKIRDFAAMAHGDQQRKFAPEPYIAHPIRVMKTCSEYTSDYRVLAAALLHDVLEDTTVTAEQMQQFLNELAGMNDANMIVKMVVELTDVYLKKDFPAWNRRKRKQKEVNRLSRVSNDAQTIKYADVIDNSLTIVDAETDFAEKYLLECRSLLRQMKNGNTLLLYRSTTVVNDCLQKLKERNMAGNK